MTRRDPTPWLRLSMAAATVAGIGSVAALLNVDQVYGQETEAFVEQAIAQDLVNLVVVTPAVLVLAVLALRGSLGAHLAWLGFVTFTVYNYVIYVFSIHFGPLFLVWVAVFGASLYALVGGLAALDFAEVRAAFGARPFRGSAGFLLFSAVLFGGLWLSDIVPALVDGTAPQAVTDVGLPTSPVHVLDLAVFLPAVAAVGVQLWRRRPLGYVGAVPMLLFLALTGLPILTTVLVADARGEDAAWQLLAPVGTITVVSAVLAGRMLADLGRRTWVPDTAAGLAPPDIARTIGG